MDIRADHTLVIQNYLHDLRFTYVKADEALTTVGVGCGDGDLSCRHIQGSNAEQHNWMIGFVAGGYLHSGLPQGRTLGTDRFDHQLRVLVWTLAKAALLQIEGIVHITQPFAQVHQFKVFL